MSRKYNGKSFLAEWSNPLKGGLRTYYSDIAMNVFKWENMPKLIPKRLPEKYLYENGLCVVFEDDLLGVLILPVAISSIQKNVYGEPSQWRAVAIGEYASRINSRLLDSTNSVLIRNDYAYQPTKPYVEAIIEQMVNIELTTRLNINAQKMPMMFKGSEQDVLQNKNTFLEFMECEPVFFKNDFASAEFNIYNSGAPFLANDMCKTYVEYDSRILTYLGINNLPTEKGERMLVDEISSNEEEMNLIRESRLNQRRVAAKAINELFGLNVSVDISELIKPDRGADDDAGTKIPVHGTQQTGQSD